jgi:hypothetical protein
MEKKTQLYFRDNNHFVFRQMPLEYSCFLEKKGDAMFRGWRHSYAGQYAFRGYKNISADTVTMGFARDIFLDPHNKIPESEETSGKPDRAAKDGVKKWIAKIAEDQRHIYRSKRKDNTMHNYINICLMGVIAVMIIGWAISFAAVRLAAR